MLSKKDGRDQEQPFTPHPIIFDTETTGFENAEIIEDGLIFLPPGDKIELVVMNKTTSRYLPKGQISYGAMATHHISKDQLVGKPPSESFKLPTYDDGPVYLIGHNVDFDWRVAGEPEGVRRICTLALSRYLWPEMDSHSLGAMIYSLKTPYEARTMLKDAHSALADCEMTRHLLRNIVTVLVKRQGMAPLWGALWAMSEVARIPTVMPFGKHRGEKIADLPGDYVAWLKRQPDLDPYLRVALFGPQENVE